MAAETFHHSLCRRTALIEAWLNARERHAVSDSSCGGSPSKPARLWRIVVKLPIVGAALGGGTPHAGRIVAAGALVLVIFSGSLLVGSNNPEQARTSRAAADTPHAMASLEPSLASRATGGVSPSVRQVAPSATAAAKPMTVRVEAGVRGAAASGVQQAVTVIDRQTGDILANHNGDDQFNSESITKLFTVAYYLSQVNGVPDGGLADDLRSLIQESNNTVQTYLWRPDIVTTVADRYLLSNTDNSATATANSWGSDQITAKDMATFLYASLQDPLIGPHLTTWMSGTPSTGADGFNQAFGLNTVRGNHGSKQGWSDSGWSPANLHSVGFTDRYVVAVLQTSPTASFATMRSASTATVSLIAAGTR